MRQVLLLNVGYEPLNVISWRRALSLMLRDRVDAATEEGLDVRSVSSVLRIPYVLRLRHTVHVPRRTARCSRLAVLRRDRYTCAYCGARPGDVQRGHVMGRWDMTVDHILPSSRGGKTTWTNMVCACRACNQYKKDRTPQEAGMRLRWQPVIPHGPYGLALGETPSAWNMYRGEEWQMTKAAV